MRIDGRDDKGALIVGGVTPVLPLDIKKASKLGEIFISIKIKPSESAGGFEIKEDEKTKALSSDDLEIVQTDSHRGPKDGHSYYPIAIIHLSSDRKSVDDVFQVVHHNLRYTFQERNASAAELEEDPTTPKIGRGIFYPV